MKFTAQANDVAAALLKVRGSVPGRTTIPILECVLFDVGEQFAATATNLDAEARATAPCEVVHTGSVAVPAAIVQTIKAMGKREIDVSLSDGRLTVKGGKSSYEFATLSAADFPQMTMDADDAQSFTIDAGALASALGATSKFASQDETRYYMAGTHLDLEGAFLSFVATDGHRLHRMLCPKHDAMSDTYGAIVPSEAIKQICTILEGDDGDVSVKLTRTTIAVASRNASITAKLIQGTYPDYRRVIPRYNDRKFSVEAHEIIDAIDRMYAIDDGKGAAILCKTAGDRIEIHSPRTGAHTGLEVVDADVSAPGEFGVNGRYLSGLASMWPSDATLDFSFADAGSPILITSRDFPNQTQVLMPMRY